MISRFGEVTGNMFSGRQNNYDGSAIVTESRVNEMAARPAELNNTVAYVEGLFLDMSDGRVDDFRFTMIYNGPMTQQGG